jgi:hypothetical protein
VLACCEQGWLSGDVTSAVNGEWCSGALATLSADGKFQAQEAAREEVPFRRHEQALPACPEHELTHPDVDLVIRRAVLHRTEHIVRERHPEALRVVAGQRREVERLSVARHPPLGRADRVQPHRAVRVA